MRTLIASTARAHIRAGRDAEQDRHRDHGAQQTQNVNLRLRDPASQALDE